MLRSCFFTVLITTLPVSGYSQHPKERGDIVYDTVTEDHLKDYKNAKMLVDYYFTDGISTSDRYSYEIMVADSLLMVAFHSPGTDSYKYVSYEKETLLTDTQANLLGIAITLAKLRQTKTGIPRTRYSAYTKEVLTVHYQNTHIL